MSRGGLITCEDFDQHTEVWFFPPGESLLVPLRLQQSQNDCRWELLGSRGDHVGGMVYLEAYVGSCPTLFVRSNKTPWWSECVVFWESSV